MIYNFAIDETGKFEFNTKDKSFACGVFTNSNEKTLKQKYQEVFKLFYPDMEVPNNTNDLIGNKKFHFSDIKTNEHRDICKDKFLHLADKIYVSNGKPLLYANNQNYWQIAVSTIIIQLFKDNTFQKGDILNIYIDCRAKMVWGTFEGTERHNEYHKILQDQFERLVKDYRTYLSIEINIYFKNDTDSFFVNFADIICGIIRTNKDVNTIKCSCESFQTGVNPSNILNSNPISALNTIFQEVLNNQFGNIILITKVFKASRNNEERYNLLWDVFYNFLKFQIKQGYTAENNIKAVVDMFKNEFRDNYLYVSADKQLDLINLFVEYVSHNGEIELPFKESFIKERLNSSIETRITRKWEKLISYHLHSAQVLFNSYNFNLAIKELEDLWEKQENILSTLSFLGKRDEHTTAIIGTLAQSYAFNGEIDKAIEYFNLSLDYTLKTASQTYSFIMTCHIKNKNIKEARDSFEKLTNTIPENYNYDKDKNIWNLLAYTKLRALELHENKRTNLPEIIPSSINTRNYPYPLIIKWVSIALILENPIANKEKISFYLNMGIEELLKEQNGLTLKSLSLSLIQIYALVDNSNTYHAKYNNLLNELKKECIGFENYTKRDDFLNNIKNDSELWQRATFLPFNYS